MSSWGNNDNAANAPYWAVNSTIVNAADVKSVAAAPTAANVALLYANTQTDAYTVGETIGLFGVDAQEASATNHVHTGWVLKTTGSGGRAARGGRRRTCAFLAGHQRLAQRRRPHRLQAVRKAAGQRGCTNPFVRRQQPGDAYAQGRSLGIEGARRLSGERAGDRRSAREAAGLESRANGKRRRIAAAAAESRGAACQIGRAHV